MERDEIIKFSPNQKLPPGYQVIWSPETEHYHAETIDKEWSSDIYCNRFDARRVAWSRFNKQASHE